MGADVVAAHHSNRLPEPGLRLASDQRLVDEVRAGSEQAFEVLFDRHYRPVLAFCRHMLGSKEEAEDALQQTLLSAYRAIARGEQPRSVRPWLYAIARNRCISVLRSRRPRSLEHVPEREGDTLLSEVSRREDLRAMLADVARLPEDQRAALVLAELGGTSHAEIAGIVGCPQEKVKALVFQARSSLTAQRTAREISCAEVQAQLAAVHGALRRRVLRRHLQDCPGCRAFRDKVRAQQRQLGLLLPVATAMGLKRSLLGALFGSGGGGAGAAALTAGTLTGAGLAVTALVAVAVPGGPLAAGTSPSRDGREPARAVAHVRPPGQSAPSAAAWTAAVGTERLASRRGSEDRSAITHTPVVPEHAARSTPTGANADDAPPAASEDAGAPDRADQGGSAHEAVPATPRHTAEPPELPADDPSVEPARRDTPQQADRHAPRRPPDRPVTPAAPPNANPPVVPGKPSDPPGAPTPAKPDGHPQAPPVAAAPEPAANHGPSAAPSPGGAAPAGATGNGGDGHGHPGG